MKNILYILTISLFLVSCSEEVDLDLPDTDQKVVVEAYVETGRAPYVILTRSLPYFQEITQDDLANLFITDATNVVVRNDKGESDTLVFQFNPTGYPQFFYAASNPTVFGEENTKYYLELTADGEDITAETYVPAIVPLDSLWYQLEEDEDSLGVIYANLTDPDTLGNYYRWTARQLDEDIRFVAPTGATVNDEIINGNSFQFYYFKGIDPLNPNQEEGDSAEFNVDDFYFDLGSTVLVRFANMTYPTYNFWKLKENDAQNSGNPFAAPISTSSNVEGALGNFSGFASRVDTIICIPKN